MTAMVAAVVPSAKVTVLVLCAMVQATPNPQARIAPVKTAFIDSMASAPSRIVNPQCSKMRLVISLASEEWE
jgi:hypothetical protein